LFSFYPTCKGCFVSPRDRKSFDQRLKTQHVFIMLFLFWTMWMYVEITGYSKRVAFINDVKQFMKDGDEIRKDIEEIRKEVEKDN